MHVVVILAVPHMAALDDGSSTEAVSYSFGINAEDAGAAARLAERAAEHARDRDGVYIGGVVAEFQVTRVRAEEFEGYEDYLIQPLTSLGIFYVTGTTTFFMPRERTAAVTDALAALRQSIRQHGVPAPSFAHPKPPDPPPPKPARIVCPGCHRWAQFDSDGIIYSFYEGLDPASRESQIGRQAGRALGTFMEAHASCLPYATSPAFVFLYEGDPRYDDLDAAMAE